MPDVNAQTQSQLEEGAFIRGQLFQSDRSMLRRYADIVVGRECNYLALLKYEIITSLFSLLPGAIGLALRKIFYPMLFAKCGRGVVFGRNLVIRNANKIHIGDNVIIDDDCVIDGRGAGDELVVIGDRVILGRGVMVQAKIGPVHIGNDSDIGSSSIVHAQGGTYIGNEVVIGGGAKISGGVFQIDKEPEDAEGGEQAERGQTRWTNGPIRIGDRCLIGMACIFLDGVEVGEGCVVGAGSLVNKSKPAFSVVAGSPARVLRER